VEEWKKSKHGGGCMAKWKIHTLDGALSQNQASGMNNAAGKNTVKTEQHQPWDDRYSHIFVRIVCDKSQIAI
jgi:hypothetical protein